MQHHFLFAQSASAELPALFEKYRKEILHSQLLMAESKVQKEDQVTHVLARRLHRMDDLLGLLGSDEQRQANLRTLAHLDEQDGEVFPAKNKRTQVRHEEQMELFPKDTNLRLILKVLAQVLYNV